MPARMSLPTQIASLALAALLAFVSLLWVSVITFTGRMDRTAAQESVTHVRERIDGLREQVAIVAADYTNWTDLFDAARRGDVDFLAENYGVSAVRGQVFDHAMLYGGPFAQPLAWRLGGGLAPLPSFLPEAMMERIAAEVARLPLGTRATFDFTLWVDGSAVQFSASHLLPDTAADVPSHRQDFAVATIGRAISADRLEEVRRDLSLGPITISPDAPPDTRGSVALQDAFGAPTAYLSWVPPQPGTELMTRVRPLLAAITLVAAVVAVSAAWLVHANARALLQREAAAARMARTDSLTGLPNRHAYTEELDRLSRMGSGRVVVAMLDLDGFKHVNDVGGHEAGDRFLRAFAGRLRHLELDGWFIARIGGDEFAALFGPATDPEAEGMVRSLPHRLDALLEAPAVAGPRSFTLSASRGMATGPSYQIDQLVREADAAMYEAKRLRQAVQPLRPRLRPA